MVPNFIVTPLQVRYERNTKRKQFRHFSPLIFKSKSTKLQESVNLERFGILNKKTLSSLNYASKHLCQNSAILVIQGVDFCVF